MSRPKPALLVWLVLLVLALEALPRLSAAQTTEAPASSAPLQLAVWNPIQVLGEGVSVAGLRLSVISGANHDVVGLDLSGIAALTRGDQSGLQIALYGGVDGDLTGWQVGGLANDVDGLARGLQTAGAYNRAGEAVGLQLSAALNQTRRVRGLQISLINWTDELDGVQIGLINVNRRGRIPFLPVFNFDF